MQSQDYTLIDVKVHLVTSGNMTSAPVKRIKAPATLKQLQQTIATFATKHGIHHAPTAIKYRENEIMLDLDDEDDYSLGMEQALKSKPPVMSFYAHFQQSAYPELEEKKEATSTAASTEGVDVEMDDAPTKGVQKDKKGGKKEKMPRKALKNLINNELTKQSREVFNELLMSKDLCGAIPKDEDAELYEDPQDDVVHLNVSCDGCGVNPIKGIRYKCSIRKNFDLCEVCEERLGHDQPFLKIRKAGGAPDVLITMLPENAPETPDEKEARLGGQRQETAGEAFGQETGRPGGERCGRGGGHHGFRGGRGGRGGHGHGPHGHGHGMGRGMGGGFMKMVNGFMEKMGGKDACMEMKQDWMKTMQEGTEEQKQEQWKKFGEKMTQFGEHAKDFQPEFNNEDCKKWGGMNWGKGGCGKNWGADGEGNSWKTQRAKLISKPETVLQACPGTSLIEEIEVLNDTYWPWKQGCSLTLADEQTFTENPIEIINVPVEQEVKGKTTMKMSIALTVPAHIQADNEKIHTINFTFRGPKGQAFGEVIPIQLKVTFPNGEVDELEIYKLAIKLHEMNLGSFEECAKAVKENGCDEATSIEVLQRK